MRGMSEIKGTGLHFMIKLGEKKGMVEVDEGTVEGGDLRVMRDIIL